MKAIDLFSLLSKFHPRKDVESKIAFFKTHVPWVAPEAYFNIIYKPLRLDAVNAAAQRLRVPGPLTQFFRGYNGAILFAGALSIYGIHPPGALLERDDIFLVLPFDIEAEGRSWPPYDPDRLFEFGGYSWDGSRICIDRADHRIFVFKRGSGELESTPTASWPSFEEWLTSEIARLSFLFDESGKILVHESHTLPHAIAPS